MFYQVVLQEVLMSQKILTALSLTFMKLYFLKRLRGSFTILRYKTAFVKHTSFFFFFCPIHHTASVLLLQPWPQTSSPQHVAPEVPQKEMKSSE